MSSTFTTENFNSKCVDFVVDQDPKKFQVEVEYSSKGLWAEFMTQICSKLSIDESEIRFVKLGDVLLEDDIDIYHLEKNDFLTVITSKTPQQN